MTYERFEDLPVWRKAAELQNSDIKGQRHLNEKVRERDRVARKANEFRTNFLKNLKPEHPLYKTDEARVARGERIDD